MGTMLTVVVMVVVSGVACERRPSRVVFGIGMTRDIHVAVVLAAREINAAGGIGGVPLELTGLEWVGFEDGFRPETVLAWANRFVANKGLVAVIGHSDSASTLSAAAIYNANHVPQVVTIATNPAITGIGEWTYRLCLSDAAQGPTLAEYAVNDWHKRRLAIISVNDAYGSGLTESFETRARELGAQIVGTVMHRNLLQPDDQETIRLALDRMKHTGPPDLIVLFQRVAAATWTLRAIRDAGLDAGILGGDNLAQYAFITGSPNRAEGIRVSQFSSINLENVRARRFAETFRAETGTSPDYTQAFAYDAVYLLRDAVLEGGYTRERVRAQLDRFIRDRRVVHGVGGDFVLQENHDARRDLYVAEIRNGEFHVVKSVPAK
jgi:branched-chain amino acid transport system substrate-binding protein